MTIKQARELEDVIFSVRWVRGKVVDALEDETKPLDKGEIRDMLSEAVASLRQLCEEITGETID